MTSPAVTRATPRRAPRDISRAQYLKRMLAYGFRPHGVMGYWALPAPLDHVSVSDWNANTYRGRLAYMLAALEQEQRRAERIAAERAARGAK